MLRQNAGQPRQTAESNPATEPLAYSVPEAGKLLGVSRNTAYQAAKIGLIPSVLIGGRRIVPRAALMRLLDPQVS
jgi:excisionase family DNA binding protein